MAGKGVGGAGHTPSRASSFPSDAYLVGGGRLVERRASLGSRSELSGVFSQFPDSFVSYADSLGSLSIPDAGGSSDALSTPHQVRGHGVVRSASQYGGGDFGHGHGIGLQGVRGALHTDGLDLDSLPMSGAGGSGALSTDGYVVGGSSVYSDASSVASSQLGIDDIQLASGSMMDRLKDVFGQFSSSDESSMDDSLDIEQSFNNQSFDSTQVVKDLESSVLEAQKADIHEVAAAEVQKVTDSKLSNEGAAFDDGVCMQHVNNKIACMLAKNLGSDYTLESSSIKTEQLHLKDQANKVSLNSTVDIHVKDSGGDTKHLTGVMMLREIGSDDEIPSDIPNDCQVRIGTKTFEMILGLHHKTTLDGKNVDTKAFQAVAKALGQNIGPKGINGVDVENQIVQVGHKTSNCLGINSLHDDNELAFTTFNGTNIMPLRLTSFRSAAIDPEQVTDKLTRIPGAQDTDLLVRDVEPEPGQVDPTPVEPIPTTPSPTSRVIFNGAYEVVTPTPPSSPNDAFRGNKPLHRELVASYIKDDVDRYNQLVGRYAGQGNVKNNLL